jgi:Family of unknown function (DUF6062)
LTDTLFLADFRRATQSPTCPFCTLRDSTTTRYMGSLLGELTLAGDIHQRLAQSRGFCAAHARTTLAFVLKQGGEGGGVAVLYTSILQTLRAELAAGLTETVAAPAKPRWRRPAPSAPGASLARRLAPTRLCLLCEHEQENESFALGQLVEDLQERGGESPLAQLYQASPGACLPHFQHLLTLAQDEASVRWLAECQAAQWATLEAELEAYRLGKSGGESWQQALAQVRGEIS